MFLYSQDLDQYDARYYYRLGRQVIAYNGNWGRAVTYFLKADSLSDYRQNPRIRYWLGRAYVEGPYYAAASALPYLKSILPYARKLPYDYYFYLARAYHSAMNLDTALFYYQVFLSKAKIRRLFAFIDPHLKDLIDRTQKHLNEVFYAKEHIGDSVKVRIINMGPNINTRYHEYAPAISTDESILFFTSRRPGNIGGTRNQYGEIDTVGGDWYEDIYVSIRVDTQWMPAVNVGVPVNTPGHDASVGLSPDGNYLFIYRDIKSAPMDLFQVVGSIQGWQMPKPLPPPINSPYWEGSLTMTQSGDTIIFSSDRPGGIGGKDLWMTYRINDSTWAEPVNLGLPINTPGDEDAPFLHPDGRTLYYSSNGKPGFGGYDIYVAQRIAGGWVEPANLGYPINSPEDDIFFYLNADRTRGYVASARPGGYGGQDLYILDFTIGKKPVKKEEIPIVFKGTIYKFAPTSVRIKLVNSRQDTFLSPRYAADQSIVDYVMVVPRDSVWTVVLEVDSPYLPVTASIRVADTVKEVRRNFIVGKVARGATLVLRNVYFAFNSDSILPASERELRRVLNLLKRYPDKRIYLVGHADAKGSLKYNWDLSQRRAQAVRQWLIEHGVPPERLRAKGMGEVWPERVNFHPDGSDWPEHRAYNRRVEFIVAGGGPDTSWYEPYQGVDPLKAPTIEKVKELPQPGWYVQIVESASKLPPDFFYRMGQTILAVEKQIGTTRVRAYYVGPFDSHEQAQKRKQLIEQLGLYTAKIIGE